LGYPTHRKETTHEKTPPIAFTIPAILAGMAADFSAIHAIQYLGIIPFFIGGTVPVRYFSFFSALMYSIIVCLIILLYCMLSGVRRAFGTAAF